MDYFEANRMGATFLPAFRALMTTPRSFLAAMPGTAYFREGIALLTLVVLVATAISIPFRGFSMAFMVPFVWGFMLLSSRLLAAYLALTAGSGLTSANAFLLVAYASVPQVAAMVPYIAVPAGLWSLYLLWLGLVVRGGVNPVRAAMVLCVPVVVVAGLVGVLMVMVLPHFSLHM